MGGAQPLAIKMNNGICIAVECDRKRIERRIKAGFCDMVVEDIDEAVEIAEQAKEEGEPKSIAVVGNCADTHPYLVEKGFKPDVVTDQTSAHDELNGYVPAGYYEIMLKKRTS